MCACVCACAKERVPSGCHIKLLKVVIQYDDDDDDDNE